MITIENDNKVKVEVFANPTFNLIGNVIEIAMSKITSVYDGEQWSEITDARKGSYKRILITNDDLVDLSDETIIDKGRCAKFDGTYSSAPSSPADGFVYLNTTDSILYKYDGDSFVEEEYLVEIKYAIDSTDGKYYRKNEGLFSEVDVLPAFDFVLSRTSAEIGLTSVDDMIYPAMAQSIEDFIVNNNLLS